MGVRENNVESYFNEQIENIGGITRKWVSPGHDGVPDRIVFIHGKVIFVEIKTCDGQLSPIQDREIMKLKKHGANVFVVFGHYHVDVFIEALVNGKI